MPEDLASDVATRWTAAMRAGDWEGAWRQTDRIELPRRVQQALPGFARGPQHLVWDGSAPDDRVVMVRCLHGLGDTLQFMRFVPALEARARLLHFLVQPSLLQLLHDAPGLGLVSNAWTDEPPAHEVEIEVMELAYVLRTTAQSLPPPYPALADAVRERNGFVLPAEPHQLRVGLVWASSGWDRTRSIPLEALAPLLAVPGVRFYDLQQETQARPAPAVALWRHTADAASAAAAMLELDLVVTVDGMPAHLAATLGRPTWLLLKEDADWRWGELRPHTPWYPSMRLFRQRAGEGWTALVGEVADALREQVAAFQAAEERG
ncbi:hypothetical protein WG922_02995 [Ramlibacter sp. AN1015]|uniref:hypothetical protein n=1 Tax=Ramlibacter sp. AN1015 TaxID=3133428 RepID=UPI0030BFABD5